MESVAPQSSGEVDVIGLLRIFWRYKILILIVTALSVGYSVYLAMNAKYFYQAQTLVTQVSDSGGNASLMGQFGGLANLAGVDIGGGGQINSGLAILNSRSLAESFLKKYQLVDVIRDELGGDSLWFAVKKFREQVLLIAENEKTGSISVAMMWTDPERAAKWANSYVELANETIRAKAVAEAQTKVDYLSSQINATSVVELERVLYKLIENETKALMLANVRSEYAFSVVDTAVPPELRSRPRRKIIVMNGAILGMALSLMLVAVIHLYSRVTAK